MTAFGRQNFTVTLDLPSSGAAAGRYCNLFSKLTKPGGRKRSSELDLGKVEVKNFGTRTQSDTPGRRGNASRTIEKTSLPRFYH
eukprot:758080-Hanusia_phi.AAC.12